MATSDITSPHIPASLARWLERARRSSKLFLESVGERPDYRDDQSYPWGSNDLLRRYLDPPNPPQTHSEKVLGAVGYMF